MNVLLVRFAMMLIQAIQDRKLEVIPSDRCSVAAGKEVGFVLPRGWHRTAENRSLVEDSVGLSVPDCWSAGN